MVSNPEPLREEETEMTDTRTIKYALNKPVEDRKRVVGLRHAFVSLTFECRGCRNNNLECVERFLDHRVSNLESRKLDLSNHSRRRHVTLTANDNRKEQCVFFLTEIQCIQFSGELEHRSNHFFTDDFTHPLTRVLKAVG